MARIPTTGALSLIGIKRHNSNGSYNAINSHENISLLDQSKVYNGPSSPASMETIREINSSVSTGLTSAVYTENVSSSVTWSSRSHSVDSSLIGATVRVVWKYVNGSSYQGDFQLDDFNLFGTSYSPESGIASGWQTSTANSTTYPASFSSLTTSTSTNRWNRDASGTPSGGTGLGAGNTGNYYYYAETSGTSGQTYWLRSPAITIGSNTTISYYKANYGSNVGNYSIYLDVTSL